MVGRIKIRIKIGIEIGTEIGIEIGRRIMLGYLCRFLVLSIRLNWIRILFIRLRERRIRGRENYAAIKDKNRNRSKNRDRKISKAPTSSQKCTKLLIARLPFELRHNW